MEDDFDFFDIKQHRLDEEWLSQVKLMGQYAKKLADAKKVHSQSKAGYELIEAEIALKVRKSPELFGFDTEKKPTEDAIKKTVITNKKVIAAQNSMIDARHDVDVLEGVVSAMDHRKKALENLVVLWTRDYFAAPKVNEPDAKRKMEEVEADRAFKPKREKR